MSQDSSHSRFTAARRPKIAELVAADIRSQIIRGELHADDSLPVESELCEIFSISRPTLREAFRILESEGLITIRQGQRGGPTVNEPTVHGASRYVGLLLQYLGVSIRDVDVAFEMIVPAAAGRLAGHHGKREIKKLRAHLDQLEDARNDFARFLETLAGFNYLLLDLTGNQTIGVLGRLLADIVTVHITRMAEDWSSQPPVRLAYVEAGIAACQRLVGLIENGEVAEAQSFWAGQMERGDRRALHFKDVDRVLDMLS